MREGKRGRSWDHVPNPIILYFSVYCTKKRTDRHIFYRLYGLFLLQLVTKTTEFFPHIHSNLSIIN
jgi:hypothetical protein